MLAHQPLHLPTRDRDRLRLLDHVDRGRARFAAEHGEFTEDVTRAEVRERDRTPVRVLADRACQSGPHDVTGVALVALAEDDLACGVAPRHGYLGHGREVVLGKPGEDGHVAQERDALGAVGRIGHRYRAPPARWIRSRIPPERIRRPRPKRCGLLHGVEGVLAAPLT